MYLRAAHAETHLQPLIGLILQNPLGIFTTALNSGSYPLIQHTHLPWILHPPTNLSALERSGQADAKPISNVLQPVVGLEGCKLRGHLARANPHAKALIEAVGASNGQLSAEVTVLFSSPAQHYITPRYYVETKPETGKVVPTWNYAAVECRGLVRVFHDRSDETGAYLQEQIEELTGMAESGLEGGFGRQRKEGERASSGEGLWEVRDAPDKYVEIMKKAILGVEIEVTSIVGKFKMSQELKEGDRSGVLEGLRGRNDGRSELVAEVVESRSNGH